MKHTFKQVIFVALLAVSLACVLGISVSAVSHTVTDEQELIAAVATASAGDTIEIANDITINAPITINRELTITAPSATTITTADKAFVINGADLTLSGALNITSTSTTTGVSVIELTGSAPTLTICLASDAYTIGSAIPTQGNTNYMGECGTICVTGSDAAVQLESGTLTNTSGEVIKVPSGGQNFSFVMSGGAIVTVSKGARAILSSTYTSISISGGTMTLNQRLIQCNNALMFFMDGGTINVKNDVLVQADGAMGTYTMEGGTINYVSDTLYGNGIFYASGDYSSLTMTGGTINGSSSCAKLTGADCSITVSGGTLTAINRTNQSDGLLWLSGINATVTITGGDMTTASRSVVLVSHTGGTHTVSITGGSLKTTYSTKDSWRGVVDVAGDSDVTIAGTAEAIDMVNNTSQNGLMIRQGSHTITLGGNARIHGGYTGMHVWYATTNVEVLIKENVTVSAYNSNAIIHTAKGDNSVYQIQGGTVEVAAAGGKGIQFGWNYSGAQFQMAGTVSLQVTGGTIKGGSSGPAIDIHVWSQTTSVFVENATLQGVTGIAAAHPLAITIGAGTVIQAVTGIDITHTDTGTVSYTASGVTSYAPPATFGGSAITITGGTINASVVAINVPNDADTPHLISVTGGSLNCEGGSVIALGTDTANVTVTGGTFRTITAAVTISGANTTVTIESGNFQNAQAILVYTVSNSNVTLGKAGVAITVPTGGLLYVLPTAGAAQPTFAIDGITPYSANGTDYYDTQAHAEGADLVAYIEVEGVRTYYTSLTDAIDAANANSAAQATEIVLLRSFKLDAQIEISDKKFTLKGESITVMSPDTGDRRIFYITGAATITVADSVKLLAYNRVFQIETAAACAVVVVITDDAQVISQTNSAIVNDTASAATSVTVTLQGNGLIRTDDAAYYTFYNATSTVEVNIQVFGGLMDSFRHAIQSNGRTDITVTGGELRQRSTASGTDLILLDAGTPDDQANTLTMTGGKLTSASRYIVYARNATTVNITGGEIIAKSSFYNEWINTGSVNYTPTKTIINIGGNAKITAGEHGLQIVSEDAEVTFSGNAVLIAGSVGIQFAANSGKAVLTITGGTITAGRYAVNYQGVDIFESTITGGTLTGGASENYSGIRVTATAQAVYMTISGTPKIIGKTSAVWLEKGTLTVYGGTLIAVNDNAIGMVSGVLTIYGGTFRSGGHGLWLGGTSSTMTLNLNGGSFILSGAGAVLNNLNAENTLHLNAFNAVGGSAVLKNPEDTIVIAYPDATATYVKNTVANVAGAQVRLVPDTSGLRFIGNMSAAAIAHLASIGATNVSYGTLILPTDLLVNADAFSIAELERAEILYLNVAAQNGLIGSDAGGYTIRVALIDIKTFNYGRNFSAVAYASYMVDGKQVVQYAAYTAEASSRSVAYVAAAALADPSAYYSAEQRAILQNYANYYSGTPVAMMPTVTALPAFGKKQSA